MYRHIQLSLLLLCVVFRLAETVQAQEGRKAPQYRFGRVTIPAADDDEPVAPEFSADAARRHLELGVSLWSRQKKCVSCHTHGIYMITRPAMAPYWGKPPEELRAFVVSVAHEAMDGKRTNGSTPGQLSYIARGLAEWDAQFGGTTSADTDAVLRHVLEMPSTDGSIRPQYRWPPLNSDPWHASIMAAMAVATAPGWRATLPPGFHGRIEQLEAYLRDTPLEHDHQRLLLLWASTRRPTLLDPRRRAEILQMIWDQQLDDGGWSIRSFATAEALGGGRKAQKLKAEPDYRNPASDGYQTGLAIIVLRDAGIPAEDARIQRAVKWLVSNQRESGRWWTRSLNVDSRFHYITYSGTAYAVLALAKCGVLQETAGH